MKSLLKIAAFGAGAAIGTIILGEAINIALAISARKLDDAVRA